MLKQTWVFNMSQKKFRSLRTKLVLLLSFSALIALILSSVAIFIYTYNEKNKDVLQSLSQITKIMAENLIATVEFNDSDGADVILNTLKLDENIDGAFVSTQTDIIFSSYVSENSPKDLLNKVIDKVYENDNLTEYIEYIDARFIVVSTPIYLEKEYIGTFCVISNTNAFKETIKEQIIVLFVVFILSLAIVVILAFKMQSSFTSPIFQMKDAMEKITLNDNRNNQHIISNTNDEFKILFNGFNNMIDKIAQQSLELTKQKEQIELILENILLPVIITSKETRKVLYVNSYAEKQYEATAEEMLGKSIDFTYINEDQKNVILNEFAKKGYIHNLEQRYQTMQGNEFEGLLSLVPIEYNSQDSYIGMVTDITEQKEREKEIATMHNHTKDSIEYASLIQGALIPDNSLLRKYFKDYFAIWHPKDMVGGDIYLLEELRNEEECLLMVIDCTGHGVPGAFVTMLVKAIERQVVGKILSDDSIEVSPAWILAYFNKTMKKLLKQEDVDSVSNAGFDGQVFYYNKRENIVKFASARNELFYYQDDVLNVVKGNRHSIGYRDSDAKYEFTDHIIEINKDSKFYLSTDGYWDQNGGEKGLPFGKKRLKKMLEEIHPYSMSDQQEEFVYRMHEYQADMDRQDDITVIGFEIKKGGTNA